MKRLSSSDSSGALMTICPSTDEQSPRTNHVYGGEFQSMLDGLDEEGSVEEPGQASEKKRRLSVDQVKALEKNFEVENKLEPERKVKLAQELGLQPRQVAVWFQNRRARWKTKQLEKDYGVLKVNYEALKLNYESLQHDNQVLLKEIKELKSKLQVENTESDLSVKEEINLPDSDVKMTERNNQLAAEILIPDSETETNGTDLNYECFHSCNEVGVVASLFPAEFKDSSSDSDSSAILNEDNGQNHQLFISPGSSSLKFNCSSSSSPSSVNCFQLQRGAYQAHYVKTEEHNFFSTEEECNFFSEEQAPSLHWYSDQLI